MGDFTKALAGGDRRSIGKADAVAAAVESEPRRFGELWDCLAHRDPLVRMRAADALEKLSRSDAGPFRDHKDELLAQTLDDGTSEVRWHLVAITGRLAMSPAEAERAIAYFEDRLRHDPSRIVKAMALRAAADVCARQPKLAGRFEELLAFARASPWASLRARARNLNPAPVRP